MRGLPDGWLGPVTLVVESYDPAIEFFVQKLGFELAEDSPSLTNDGRPKRWVVVVPPGGQTGLLLAQADGDDQAAVVGRKVAGRVGFFLRVDDFDQTYDRMASVGVEFVNAPCTEPYGKYAVFLDIAGNRWDLIGPHRAAPHADNDRVSNPAKWDTFQTEKVRSQASHAPSSRCT